MNKLVLIRSVNILVKSANPPPLFSLIFFEAIRTVTIAFASPNRSSYQQRYHKTFKHNSKISTQEALVNTGTLNLKKSQEFALGGGVIFNILEISGD